MSVCLAVGLAGCGAWPSATESGPVTDTTSTGVTTPEPASGSARPGSPDAAARALAALPATRRVTPSAAGYSRSAFGRSWVDIDGNGCNQRDDVLLRDAVPGTIRVAVQGRCDHDVLAGRWIDPYMGRDLRFDDLKAPAQARAIQIDHVVPLAEAWVSGAAEWTDDRRRAFANSLPELLAVDGPTNAGKGDGDPAAWRPKKPYQCAYAIRWIGVKAAWGLAVDDSERRALTEMLGYCAR